MINFLRRIRRNLITGNKPTIYLIYAIGEVVLVVVGILIALQIDKLNEKRKTEVLEIQFLMRLEKDLISDTIYFNRRIKDSEDLIKGHYLFIHEAYNEQKDDGEFKELVDNLWWNSENFISQNSTYLELQSSGRLNIFKNEELKKKIISLYKEYDIASAHIKEYNEVTASLLTRAELTHAKYWKPYSNIFDEPQMFNENEWDFINDPISFKFRILEENAAHYSGKHAVFINYFIDLKSKAKLLKNDITGEIENRN
jgi:hypothetical protein